MSAIFIFLLLQVVQLLVEAEDFSDNLIEFLKDAVMPCVLDVNDRCRGERPLHLVDTGAVRTHFVLIAPDHHHRTRMAPYSGVQLLHTSQWEEPVSREERAQVTGRVVDLPLHHVRLLVNQRLCRRSVSFLIEIVQLGVDELPFPIRHEIFTEVFLEQIAVLRNRLVVDADGTDKN